MPLIDQAISNVEMSVRELLSVMLARRVTWSPSRRVEPSRGEEITTVERVCLMPTLESLTQAEEIRHAVRTVVFDFLNLFMTCLFVLQDSKTTEGESA